MCRSIKRLRDGAVPVSHDEIEAAARQYVRKVSGFTTPAKHNTEVFEAAVSDIAAASERLLDGLVIRGASPAT